LDQRHLQAERNRFHYAVRRRATLRGPRICGS
jgi:hypothetical protein